MDWRLRSVKPEYERGLLDGMFKLLRELLMSKCKLYLLNNDTYLKKKNYGIFIKLLIQKDKFVMTSIHQLTLTVIQIAIDQNGTLF